MSGGGGDGGTGSTEERVHQSHPSSAGSDGTQSLSAYPQIGTDTAAILSRSVQPVAQESAPNQVGGDDDWTSEITCPVPDHRVKTEDATATKGKFFEDYCSKRELLMGIVDGGCEQPLPIQEVIVPLALAGKCVLARCSQYGTGKTAAFAIPLLEKCSTEKREIQGLILVPTRPEALQTSSVLKELGKHMKVKCMVSTTSSRGNDVTRCNDEAHILVGTPDRVRNLVTKNVCDLKSCQMVVMDEADKLLCPEFQPIIEDLLNVLPADRQILMFSATFPVSILDFKSKYMPEAHEINFMDELTLNGVTQYNACLEEKQKVPYLNRLFLKLQVNQAIIFCNSVTRVEFLAKQITELGYSCFFIHSRMYQSQRHRAFHDFRSGKCMFLVATDIVTPGIDIESVNVVINFDFPKNAQTYLHRIGRCGRFGRSGLGISFVRKGDHFSLVRIEKELGTDIKSMPLESQ